MFEIRSKLRTTDRRSSTHVRRGRAIGLAGATEAVQTLADGSRQTSRDSQIQMLADASVQARRGASIHEIARAGVAGGGGRLPYADRIQRSFGRHDIRHVQAYQDDRAATASHSIAAAAYTVGDKVAFAGSPSLHTAAHEAAHTVQQRAGVQLRGGVGTVGDAYERHADAVADAVVHGRSAEAILDRVPSGGGAGRSSDAPVQRQLLTIGEMEDDPLPISFDDVIARVDQPLAESDLLILYSLERSDTELVFNKGQGGALSRADIRNTISAYDPAEFRHRDKYWTLMLPVTGWQHMDKAIGHSSVVDAYKIAATDHWIVTMNLDYLPQITSSTYEAVDRMDVDARTPTATMALGNGQAYERRLGNTTNLDEYGVLGSKVVSVTPKRTPKASNLAQALKRWIMATYGAWEPQQMDPRHMSTHYGNDMGIQFHYHLILPPGASFSEENKTAIGDRWTQLETAPPKPKSKPPKE